MWDAGAVPTALTVHRYSGQILAQERGFDESMQRKYGAPFVDMHRVDLQQALYTRAVELGVEFRLGERVAQIDFSGPAVKTVAGNRFAGDLIVAADGLWSRTRECFLGGDDKPQPTGDMAYRIVLSADQVEDPELRSWIENPEVHFFIGPGAHAVCYSLRAGKMYNIVLLVPDTVAAGSSKEAGSVDEMRALFKDWDPM